MKVGDKIKCIDSKGLAYLRKGKIYTISEITDTVYYTEEVGSSYGYYKHRFELYEEYNTQCIEDVIRMFN